MNKLLNNKKKKLLFLFVYFILLFPAVVFAQSAPRLQIDIGNFSSADFDAYSEVETNWIGQYISALYTYGVGLAVVLAVVMIMAGGLIWLMSGGSPDKVGKGKEFITSAMTGLLLALFSFLILQTVNPKLVNFGALTLPGISAPTGGTGTGGTGTGGTGGFRGVVGPETSLAEQQVRQQLSENGVGVWESRPGATVTEHLPDLMIDYTGDVATELGGNASNQTIIMTGAAEGVGHYSDRHGPGHNTVDYDLPNPSLEQRVTSRAVTSQSLSWGQAYYVNESINGQPYTVMYVNEGNHYHVEIHELGYREK